MSDSNHAHQAAHLQGLRHEQPFISHEWEELVEKLSTSQDPKLREIGLLEREFLKVRKSSRAA
ncbi:MAG TPA: hypothetical protein VF795_01660 [Desulfuromonadaceae bacterium]